MALGNFRCDRAIDLFQCLERLSTLTYQPVLITAEGGVFVGNVLRNAIEGEAKESLVENVGLLG